jgi:hypothetical protein
VKAKTNGNYLDVSGSNQKSFYGIFYNYKSELAKDGIVDIKVTDSNFGDGLNEGTGGWYRYSPSLCIGMGNQSATIQ